MVLVRDKDYIETAERLVFNVIGYDHPPGRATANLKYVAGVKFTGGYQAGVEYLSQFHPQYVDGWVSVPCERIRRIFRPRQGLNRLRNLRRRNRLPRGRDL